MAYLLPHIQRQDYPTQTGPSTPGDKICFWRLSQLSHMVRLKQHCRLLQENYQDTRWLPQNCCSHPPLIWVKKAIRLQDPVDFLVSRSHLIKVILWQSTQLLLTPAIHPASTRFISQTAHFLYDHPHCPETTCNLQNAAVP